jgi:hypothetical protein
MTINSHPQENNYALMPSPHSNPQSTRAEQMGQGQRQKQRARCRSSRAEQMGGGIGMHSCMAYSNSPIASPVVLSSQEFKFLYLNEDLPLRTTSNYYPCQRQLIELL